MASLLYEEDTYSPLDHHPKSPPARTVLVGIHGFASSGKDTSGKILVDHRGYERISFADPLRQLSEFVDPIVFVAPSGGHFWTYAQLLEEEGYEEAKKIGRTRKFLQQLGEGVRNILGEDTWVDAAMAKVRPGGKYVFTDVRFENEAQAIVKNGGVIVEVVRPGVEGVNDHASEKRLPDHLIDFTVQNDGSIDDLYFRLDGIAEYVESPLWLTR